MVISHLLQILYYFILMFFEIFMHLCGPLRAYIYVSVLTSEVGRARSNANTPCGVSATVSYVSHMKLADKAGYSSTSPFVTATYR